MDLQRKWEDTEHERKKTLSLLKKSIEKSKGDYERMSSMESMIKNKSSTGLGKEDTKKVSCQSVIHISQRIT
jgi:hypothetical protein